MTKILEFKNDLIEIQFDKFSAEEEADVEELAEAHNQQKLFNMSDPREVFETLLLSVQGTKAFDPFMSFLQRLLLIKDDGDNRGKTFQLIDTLVTQIVMDQRGVGEDFNAVHGISVQALLNKFKTDEDLSDAKADLDSARELIMRLTKEKADLESQLNLGHEAAASIKLKEQIALLEERNQYNHTTIETMQKNEKEAHKKYDDRLAEQNKHMQELYSALKRESESVVHLSTIREVLVTELDVYKEVVNGPESEANLDKTKIAVTRAFLLSEVERLLRKNGVTLSKMKELQDDYRQLGNLGKFQKAVTEQKAHPLEELYSHDHEGGEVEAKPVEIKPERKSVLPPARKSVLPPVKKETSEEAKEEPKLEPEPIQEIPKINLPAEEEAPKPEIQEVKKKPSAEIKQKPDKKPEEKDEPPKDDSVEGKKVEHADAGIGTGKIKFLIVFRNSRDS